MSKNSYSIVKQESGCFALFDNDLNIAIAVGTKWQMSMLQMKLEHDPIQEDIYCIVS